MKLKFEPKYVDLSPLWSAETQSSCVFLTNALVHIWMTWRSSFYIFLHLKVVPFVGLT